MASKNFFFALILGAALTFSPAGFSEEPAKTADAPEKNAAEKQPDPKPANGSPGVEKSDAGKQLSAELQQTPPVAPANPITLPPATENDPRRFLFGSQPADFSEKSYAGSVARLFSAFENKTGRALKPGKLGKVGLKIYTASGAGLATPKNLVRAVIKELEARGFSRENIFLVDLSGKTIRETGYLPKLPEAGENFEGCPVLVLDSGKYYNEKWAYANPLPSKEIVTRAGDYSLAYTQADRLSSLPMPLMFDCDFWINLPVAVDSPALGVSAALGNATLWNIGNQRRFLDNAANAQKAAVEIAGIPEFNEKFLFTLLSLERYQYIGGPTFDANFCLSENRLWLSANPLILDFLMMVRMNVAREKQNLPKISEPPVFIMGNTPPICLGSCIPAEINLVQADKNL